ncbi:MAG: DUF3373 family protein [Planctomycetes bacterium]|nr:DUF3373 family protein [Planctomycetota bacterium]
MITNKVLRMVVIACLTAMAGSAWADDTTELRQQLQEQYKAITEMQAKLIKLEQAQTAQNEKIAAIKPGEMTIPETLKWVEKLKFYGDFRYRYENISSENSGTESDAVNRNRIRVRLGLTAQVNDETTFDMRIATGKSDDPVSTNQNMGDSWTYKGIWLDRAYMTWKPGSVEGLSVLLGKLGNPFVTVGKNQLIWDSDLSMEGIAAQYNLKLSDATSLFANAGGFYVRLDDSDTDSISMFGAQGGVTHQFDKDNKLTAGLGYFDYGNLVGETYLLGTSSKGNSYSGGYLYDYNLFEGFAEYNTKIAGLPVGIYGDYVVNTASSVQEDTGWLIGTTLNKCKDPGSWEFSYDYRDLEKDAVIGTFSDSDFIGGGTNGKGHRFGVTYQLAKNTQAGVSYFMNDKYNTTTKNYDNYNRLQLDVMVKF